MMRISTKLVLVFCMLAIAGCRGMRSERSPIQPQLNMYYQERFNPQDPNPLFADNRAMRPPVAGTVARSYTRGRVDMPLGYAAPEQLGYYTGRDAADAYITDLPVEITRAMLERGMRKFNTFCAPCHAPTGDGQGIISMYGYTPAPSFHDERLRTIENGYMYEVLANGVRTMPGYRNQITVPDRWAIVAYIRALQRSQRATPADVPADELARLRAATPPAVPAPETPPPAENNGAQDEAGAANAN